MLNVVPMPGALKRRRFALESDEHMLRLPRMSDFEDWRALRMRGRSFLQPWEPLWSVHDMSEAAFRKRVARLNREYDSGTSIQLFIFMRKPEMLVGGITIGLIRRGVAQMCMLGYWMGEEYAGKGHMFAALGLVIPFVFDELRLHRIEAACIPSNDRSASLLRKAGFTQEGLLRKYLRINGVWQDHYIFSLLREDFDANTN
ncbi:[SSU ribosomal protein S5P]-alanine acetyltransferase [Martelella mediterranea]|uniref:[SSU ribosomal protein S5P]-alanine acetyltransferase n=2 Tax=Martelella mediterranea TaxID=293089 RepID=A0A4R3NP39_9HYPH|nr:[SSU ribosomal protein S5P]-alanine acetyltransferase [Martelella mediterranea]